MTKKKKLKIIVPVLILLIVLCVPEPRHYKDGGTVEYHALLYQVIRWHAFLNEGASKNPEYYYEGLEIKLLGFTVYNNAHKIEYRYCD